LPKTDERREGDSSLNQSVTDKNFVFVREVDTTLSMLGFRVRAPEGGGAEKQLKDTATNRKNLG